MVSCYTVAGMDPLASDPSKVTGIPGSSDGSLPDTGRPDADGSVTGSPEVPTTDWVITESRSPLPWVLAALGILAALGLVAAFLLRGSDDPDDRVATDAASGLDREVERRGGLSPAPGGGSAGEPSEPEVPSTEAPSVGNLILDDAHPATRALEEAVGAPHRARSVSIYPTYAFLEYQDPENPAHIDELTWRDGRVEGPEPVPLMGREDVPSQLFTLGDVNLEAVPALARRALDEFALENGEVTHVIIDRFFGGDGSVMIRVYVSDVERGGGGYLLADAEGNYVSTMD